jgi:hypothetical protein
MATPKVSPSLPLPKPPACIGGGRPPCPICPVRLRCAWADKVLFKG